jgi:putative transposase
MREWQSLAHVKWECKYHVVIVPKYRHKALFGHVHKRLGNIFQQLCRQKELELVEGHALLDHVHMVLSIPKCCRHSPWPLCVLHLPRNSYTMAKPFKWTYAGKPLTS